MSSDDELVDGYIRQLISHYLEQNEHKETLKQFHVELNENVDHSSIEEDLKTIVKDRVNFNKLVAAQRDRRDNVSINSEKLAQILQENGLQLPTFKLSTAIETSFVPIIDDSLVIDVLSMDQYLLFVCANKKIIKYDTHKQMIEKELVDDVTNRVIKSHGSTVFSCNMNGELILRNKELEQILKYKIHNRLVTAIEMIDYNSSLYTVSIGFDFKICLNKLDNGIQQLDSVKLMSNPTCLTYCIRDDQILIFVGSLENSLISVFTIQNDKLTLLYKIAMNDAEFSNYSFHPISMVVQDGLLIVGTSHTPYLRVITVAIPKIMKEEIRRDLVVSNLNTMATQDKYSNCILIQRLDDKGILIISDQGVVHGVDFKQGSCSEVAKLGIRPKTLTLTNSDSICVASHDKKICILKL